MGRLNALKLLLRLGSVFALALIVVFPYVAYVTTPLMPFPTLTSGLGSATASITDITSSNSTSQLYNGTPPSEQVYNTTNPDYSIMGTPLDEVNQTEGPITVNVLLAGDEEAQSTQYWIKRIDPPGVNLYVDWITYAKWQIERGDESLVADFGIDLRIRGAITWNSSNSLHYLDELNEDMMNRTGWDYSFFCGGYQIDILFGVTNQILFDTYGRQVAKAFPQYLGQPYYSYYPYENTMMVKWQVYWKDDNIVQHEISHILSVVPIEDHKIPSQIGFNDTCIMSYRPQWILYISEDGYIWWIVNHVMTVFLTGDYHIDCHNKILSWKYPDIDGNGKVEIKDLSMAGKANGSHLGDSNWDPRCDVNWDGTVDIKDMALIAKYFGLQIWY